MTTNKELREQILWKNLRYKNDEEKEDMYMDEARKDETLRAIEIVHRLCRGEKISIDKLREEILDELNGCGVERKDDNE